MLFLSRVRKYATIILPAAVVLLLLTLSRDHQSLSIDSPTPSEQKAKEKDFKEMLYRVPAGFCEKWRRQSANYENTFESDIIESAFGYVDSLKMIICTIPKNDCTRWRQALMTWRFSKSSYVINATRMYPIHFHYYAGTKLRISALPAKEQQWRMDKYKKFMITRHPLSRLVSAYEDKILLSGEVYSLRHLVLRVLQQHYGIPENRSSWLAKFQPGGVSFGEFIESILLEPSRMNSHWRPQLDQCNPCEINIDIIAHYEDREIVYPAILNSFNVSMPPEFSKTGEKIVNNVTLELDRVRCYYLALTKEKRRRLLAIYQRDFDAFDYQVPSWYTID